MMIWAIRLLLIVFWTALPLAGKDSCLECHRALDGNLQAPAAAYAADIHRHAGFSCVDCHGGDPNVDDPDISMSRARGFLGKISRTAVPQLCARCHSDASLIHRFKPQQRVDQLAQYQTSVHGQRLAAGDTAVANCVDCHSVHDIREVKDALAPVHPLRLPETCAKCHADTAHMVQYDLSTAQFEEYRSSVHWEALAKRRDFSAPSCASCHGNHGATPPQVTSVAAVCGTCHRLLEDLYSNSPHEPVFSAMGLAGCVTCHGNHAVHKPTTAMLAGPDSICSQCHDADSSGGKVALDMSQLILKLQSELDRSEEILGQARLAGMEVSESLLKLQEGREALVKAKVAVHNFGLDSVAEPANEGLAIARETHRAGEDALKESNFRRVGLVFSLLAIVATIAGLWLAIGYIETQPKDTSAPSGR